MRIVKRAELDEFLFTCPVCETTVIAAGDELTLKELGMGMFKPFVFTCTCPRCNEEIDIKSKKLQAIPVYNDVF